MGTITLPNFRATADAKMNTRLKDGGVYIEWSSLTDIKAWIYSDTQKAIAGRCDVSVNPEDNTKLLCEYAASKPQYLGVNRLIVQGRYNGSLKTYDKPVFNFVPRTAEANGAITISDPEVTVEIEVTDTTSSILDNTIAAALAAAAHAEHAASLVPLQVLQDCEAATAVALTAASKAPVIGENGNWWVWNSVQEAYVDTGKQAKGDTGNGISSFSVVESQEDNADNVVIVTFTDGTTETFNVKNGKTGNGIASIVQTVESPDDAGTNVITVTMTNGTVVTFNVKNGSKGQPGAAQAAYKSVDTLPAASAATMDKIYLTPSGTENVYNMSYTDFDGTNYSWLPLGTTAIQLSDYATNERADQIENEIAEFSSFGGDISSAIGGWGNNNYSEYATFNMDSSGHNGTITLLQAGGAYQRIYVNCSDLKNNQYYRVRFRIAISDNKNLSYLAAMKTIGGSGITLYDIFGKEAPLLSNGLDVDFITKKLSTWDYLYFGNAAAQGHTYPVTVTISSFSVSEFQLPKDLAEIVSAIEQNTVPKTEILDKVVNVVEKTKTLSLNNGKYINASGNLADLASYSYSTPIYVRAGTIVKVTANGTSGASCSIAIKDSLSSPSFRPMVMADVTGLKEYEYRIPYNCYVSCSGVTASLTMKFVYSEDIENVYEESKGDISQIVSGTDNLVKMQDKIDLDLNGVKVSTFASGRILIKGTATADGGRLRHIANAFTLGAGTYSWKRFGDFSPNAQVYLQKVSDDTILTSPFTLAESTQVYVGVNVVSGSTYDCDYGCCLVKGAMPAEFVPAVTAKDIVARGLSADIQALSDEIGTYEEKQVTIAVNQGSYINASGNVSSLSVGRITSPILMKAGDKIVCGADVNEAVALLSKTNAQGSEYVPIVIGDGPTNTTAYKEAVYIANEDCYVAVSGLSSNVSASVYEPTGGLVKQIADMSRGEDTPTYNILAEFENIVCVGDSLTWSQVYTSANTQRQARRTYPAVLSKLCGNTVSFMATPGDSAKMCWDDNGASIVSKTNPLAIIYLGTNQGITDTLDTDVIGDDPTAWADNNIGCYCRFVQKFKSLGYKVLLLKVWATSGTGTADKTHTNDAIEHIATRFGCAVMDVPVSKDMKFHYYPDLSGSNNVHYNDLGYAWFASALVYHTGILSADQMKMLIPQ